MDKDKFEESLDGETLETDNDVVGDNSFYINGAITMPEGVDWKNSWTKCFSGLKARGHAFSEAPVKLRIWKKLHDRYLRKLLV